MSVSIISWLDWCMWVDLQLIRPFVMWVLCAFCDLCVSNQESWKITHPCVQLTKHDKKNFECKHHTSSKAVHSRSTNWNAIHRTKKGQGSANQLRTDKKRLPWPYYVQRLVTNGQVNNLCSVSLLKIYPKSNKSLHLSAWSTPCLPASSRKKKQLFSIHHEKWRCTSTKTTIALNTKMCM